MQLSLKDFMDDLPKFITIRINPAGPGLVPAENSPASSRQKSLPLSR